MKNKGNVTALSCNLPRKQNAIQAIYCLFWKKAKKDHPQWLINELKSISN